MADPAGVAIRYRVGDIRSLGRSMITASVVHASDPVVRLDLPPDQMRALGRFLEVASDVDGRQAYFKAAAEEASRSHEAAIAARQSALDALRPAPCAAAAAWVRDILDRDPGGAVAASPLPLKPSPAGALVGGLA